jgi:hypothetical protein
VDFLLPKLNNKNNMIYAGIGSRQTPQDVLTHFMLFASTTPMMLRSGGAVGADNAFELGNNKPCEIYLPWSGYNNKVPDAWHIDCTKLANYSIAMELAHKYHPVFNRLSPAGKRLITRNVYIMLGSDLNTPVDQVICWTRDGAVFETTKDSGGTGHAIRMAIDLNIPINNLNSQLSNILDW